MMAIGNNVGFSFQAKASQNDQSVLKSFQQLSSGSRINSAKDDPAALAVAVSMVSQMGGMDQATRNASDGISMSQAADANLSGINDGLQRMRELAVQSANGTLNDSDRQALNTEFAQQQQQIQSTINSAEFNGQKLFTQDTTMTLQVGANGNNASQVAVDLKDLSSASGNSGIAGALAGKADILSSSGAQNAMAAIDQAMGRINSQRADYGATVNRLDSSIKNLSNGYEATAASKSRIQDTDYAAAMAQQTSSMILQQANLAMMGQANKMYAQTTMSLLGGVGR